MYGPLTGDLVKSVMADREREIAQLALARAATDSWDRTSKARRLLAATRGFTTRFRLGARESAAPSTSPS
jgi:hypothetical protein